MSLHFQALNVNKKMKTQKEHWKITFKLIIREKHVAPEGYCMTNMVVY